MNSSTKRVTVSSLTLIASTFALTLPIHASETDAIHGSGLMILAADESNRSETSNSGANMNGKPMSSVENAQRPGAVAKPEQVNASRLINSYQQVKSGGMFRGGEILDKTVVSTNGDELGQVTEIAISPDGNISNVVLSVGGFMGLGDRLVLLPWNALEISPSTDKIRTSITKTDIAQAPLFDGMSDGGLQLELKEPKSRTNPSN